MFNAIAQGGFGGLFFGLLIVCVIGGPIWLMRLVRIKTHNPGKRS